MKLLAIKMTLSQPNRFVNRQWTILLVYDIYRMVGTVFLFCLFWISGYSDIHNPFYILLLITYFIWCTLSFYFWHHRTFKFEQQVLWYGTIDILAIVLVINFIGHLELGLGIILFATIALLSIAIPGRIAIYFASLASVLLLLINAFHYVYGFENDLIPFFTTGIYGAGFFATALTTCFLASRVRASEMMAEQWANEAISILRVGEYFVEQFKSGVVYVEPNGNVRLINNAVRHYFNIKNNNAPCSIEHLLPDVYPKYVEFVSKLKKKREYAQTFLPDLNLRVEFFSVVFAARIYVLIVIQDMAEIEQQAQQFKLASLGRFSASIAHELRNPLGIISHAVQLMGEKHPLDDESVRLKEMIVKNCNRMNQVIRNVLQLTRQQYAKPESIELASTLKAFKSDFTLINKCEMKIVVSLNKKRTIIFDKSQLHQILVILCDNAMQHGADQNGNVYITISIENTNKGIVLNVSDTGVGIPYAKREIIFEPFFTTLITGNGMGLFIAKDLCEMNGARLALADTKQGVCFTISFNHHNEILL